MFASFEICLVTGKFAEYGADINKHRATLSLQKITTKKGNIIYSNELLSLKHYVPLQPNDRLHRVWNCEKPGFFRFAGLDKWTHHEVCKKMSDSELHITDKFCWHSGKSTAQRKYIARRASNGSLVRETGKWRINMGWLRWPVRGHVESAMERELPRCADRALNHFMAAHALQPPPTAAQH